LAGAFLQITLRIENQNRAAAAQVYLTYRDPFLKTIPGAVSKELLVRDEDVQVLHGFENAGQAGDYLKSALFVNDVVAALKPYRGGAGDQDLHLCLVPDNKGTGFLCNKGKPAPFSSSPASLTADVNCPTLLFS
jgi:hypothetical protein